MINRKRVITMRYVGWPRDKIRTYVGELEEHDRGVVLPVTKRTRVLIPWVNIIDVNYYQPDTTQRDELSITEEETPNTTLQQREHIATQKKIIKRLVQHLNQHHNELGYLLPEQCPVLYGVFDEEI